MARMTAPLKGYAIEEVKPTHRSVCSDRKCGADPVGYRVVEKTPGQQRQTKKVYCAGCGAERMRKQMRAIGSLLWPLIESEAADAPTDAPAESEED